MRPPVVATAVLLSTTVVAQVEGQIGYLWTFDELVAKAGLVAIAECVSAVDTGREALHPSLRPALPVIEMRGEFRVLAVLKAGTGHAPQVGGSLSVFYYRNDPERALRERVVKPGEPPPGLVNAGSTLDLEAKAKYLLFLAPAPNGMFQPLSGHTFPHDSVYLLWNQGRRCPTTGCS